MNLNGVSGAQTRYNIFQYVTLISFEGAAISDSDFIIINRLNLIFVLRWEAS
jgi:hypothetical protein